MQNLKKQAFLLKLRVWDEMSIPHRELAIVTSISEVTIHIVIDSKSYSHPHLFKGLFGGGSNPYLFSIYIYVSTDGDAYPYIFPGGGRHPCLCIAREGGSCLLR